MIFYKQCFALYAIIHGEVADSATVTAFLELDPRSFCNLSPGRICDSYCCCVYYYTMHCLPLKQINKLKFGLFKLYFTLTYKMVLLHGAQSIKIIRIN